MTKPLKALLTPIGCLFKGLILFITMPIIWLLMVLDLFLALGGYNKSLTFWYINKFI